MTRLKVGLALGSGSARGWSHIGVIEALEAHDIKPDIVCGCSVGAIVGAAYIAGRMQPLKDWVLALTWREIAGLVGVGLSGGGLLDGGVFTEVMRRLEIDNPIESYDRTFAAVATEMQSGREIWLRKGPIHEAARASMALPGVFSPALQGGKWLLDGGLVNPVPVSTCRALGADIIIAVNLNADLLGKHLAPVRKAKAKATVSDEAAAQADDQGAELIGGLLKTVPKRIRESVASMKPARIPSKRTAPAYLDVLASAIDIMQDHITRSRLAGEPPHVMLIPRLAHIGLFDFDRAEEAIAEGRRSVEQALPALDRLL